MGGLAGGVIIDITKSTKVAFFYFGLASFAVGVCYAIVAHTVGLVRCLRGRKGVKKEKEEDEEEEEEVKAQQRPFLEDKQSGDK